MKVKAIDLRTYIKLHMSKKYLDAWDEVSFEDKRKVVDLMIPKICAKSEKIDIVWKI